MKRKLRRRRIWRKRRILGVVGLVLTLAAGAFIVINETREESSQESVWRLHDLAMVQFQAGQHAEGAETCRQILALRPDDAIARFNLGAHLIKLGREDEGWAEVRAVAAAKPEFDQPHLLLAQRAMDEGHGSEALAELLLVVASPPAPVDAHVMLASLLRERGAHAEAMPHLRAILDDEGADVLLRVQSGIELARLHGLRALYDPAPARDRGQEMVSYERARQLAESALSGSAPTDAVRLRELLARALLGTGKTEQALASVDVALRDTEDPARRADLRVLRAQVYAVAGFDGRAEQELDDAVSGDVDPSADAFLAAAELYRARGRRDRALEVLLRGTKAHPSLVELGLAYARELSFAGKRDQAEAAFQRIADAQPESPGVQLALGDARALNADFVGARAAYEKARAFAPGELEADLRLAGLAFQEQIVLRTEAGLGFDEAEALARSVLERIPEHPVALLVLGSVQLELSHGPDDPLREEARDHLRRSVERNPLSLPAHAQLARAELALENPEEAILLLERLLASYPDDRPDLRLILAQAYRTRGDRMRAVAAARQVARALPGDLVVLGLLAETLLEAEELEEALETFRQLEKLQPQAIHPVLQQAAVLGTLGRVAQAEERFQRAEAIAETLDDDASVKATIRITASRAELYRRAGDAERAREAFGALLKDDPNNVRAIVRFARFLLASGDTRSATVELEKAISLAPSNVEARRAYCEIWFGKGKATAELIAQVKAIERLRPADPIVIYLRGKLALLQGDLKLARDRLTEFVKQRPMDADGAFALGVAHGRAGAFGDSVRLLERAGKLHVMTLEIRSALAKTRQAWAHDLMRRGRVAQAQQVLRRAVSDDPDAPGARHMLADALRYSGNVDLSEKEIRYLLRKDPSDAMARRVYAAILIQKGDTLEAARQLARYLEQERDDWPAWSMLTSLLVQRGDLDEAEKTARQARADLPDEPRTLDAVLHVLSERKKPAAVEREIRAALESAPGEAHYHYLLAAHFLQQEQWEPCMAAARKSLELDPRSSEAFRLLIDVQRHHLGDLQAALVTARELAPRVPERPDIQFLHAWLEDRTGQPEKALEILEPLARLDPPYQAGVTLSAMIHLNRKETGLARELLRKTLEVNPESADAHFLTAQSYLMDATYEGEWPKEPARSLAVDALRAAVSTYSGHSRAQNNLAFLLADEKETRASALALANELANAYPSNHKYLDTRGVVLMRMERFTEAAVAFRAALVAVDAVKRAVASAGGAQADVDRTLAKLGKLAAGYQKHLDEATEALRGE